MERERGDPHAPAAHEVAGDVVDDLVAVDVAVVVGGRDRQRVVVELAGHERADHEVARRERLVDRGRLVDAPGDRLEVRDVEGERPQVAVPAHDVERVGGDVVGRVPSTRPDDDRPVALVRARLAELGDADVALRVRRMLQQLAVVVAVPLGRLDLGRALEVQHPLGDARVGVQPPGRPDRQHEVVAGVVGEVAEVRPQQARALVDVQQLVALAVAVEGVGRHRARRQDHAQDHVRVVEQRDPAGDGVAGGRQPGRVDELVVVRAVVRGLDGHRAQRLDPGDAGGRHDVVQERAATGEALDAEQLLGVQVAGRVAVLDVAGVRHAAARDVEHGTTWPPRVRSPVYSLADAAS